MVRTFFIVISFLFIALSSVWADMDAKVVLSENALNGFLNAIGPISRTENFKLSSISGQYTWTVKNPKVTITTDKVRFQADAAIAVNVFKYDSTAYGDVEVKYDPVSNRISVKILKAAIQIYVSLFGKKINITEVDISKFYKMQFEFAGPKPLQASVDVTMPDGKVRVVSVTSSAQMALENGQIVVGTALDFAGKQK
jgi:hypothetical protein